MQEDPLNLEALRKGDNLAWDKAWPILRPIAYSAAFRVLRHEQESEDVAVLAIADLKNQMHQIESSKHLKAYLAKSARHKAIGRIKWLTAQIRDERKTDSIENHTNEDGELQIASSHVPAPGSLSEKKELIKDVASLLKYLGNPCQFYLVQHYWEGRSPGELASELELERTTVSMRILRCLGKALKLLKGNPPLMNRFKAHLGL